jgi:hypothetical protein
MSEPHGVAGCQGHTPWQRANAIRRAQSDSTMELYIKSLLELY